MNGRIDHVHDVKNSVFWWETELVRYRQQLIGDQRADVCIVGGGYTGLWTAYFLKKADPSLEITLLERSWAGCGSSGHAAGFVAALFERSHHHTVSRFGADRAKLIHGSLTSSVRRIGEFCTEYSVDADYDPCGNLFVALNDGQLRRLHQDLDAAGAMGVEEDFSWFEGDAAREVLGARGVRAVLKEGCAALINPHRLVRGLVRAVEDLGVRIFENSPVTEVDSGIVRTERGSVRCESVVVGTDPDQAGFRQFRGRAAPMWSYVLVSEPLTAEQQARLHWPGREGFEDKRNFVTVGRLTVDNRIVWNGRRPEYFYGSSTHHRHIVRARVFAELKEAWKFFMPQLADVSWSHEYGGPVGITPSMRPYVGGRSGIYYGFGYSGHGIAATHMTGEVLSDLVLGASLSAIGHELTAVERELRFPPEPLMFVGSRATTALLGLQDAAMDRGLPHRDVDLLGVALKAAGRFGR
jgi:glycine/D-amino acid oxidase-like deaminating enzyme